MTKVVLCRHRRCWRALCAAPAAAQQQDTRTYFTARITAQEVPQQLSAEEREHYSQLFRAIERQQWSEVESLLARRPDGLLTDMARAEYYTHANSPRVELPALLDWLDGGANLPQAPQIGRLGRDARGRICAGPALCPRSPVAEHHAAPGAARAR